MDTRLDALLAEAGTYSAFADHARHLVTSADLDAVVAAAQEAMNRGEAEAVTVWADATGDRTDVEPTGGPKGVRARLDPGAAPAKSGPGRPKLGVVSREVSLLPRQWEWLNSQPGGASGAIRRLVDEARKRSRAADAARSARDAAARAMGVLAGDRPGYEEALRALYAGRFEDATALVAAWPEDVGDHVARLVDVAERLQALAAEEAERGGADAR